LIVQGEPNKRIGEFLGLSEGTVKVYITRILRKLNVRNRTQAAFAVKQLAEAPLFAGPRVGARDD